MNVRAEAQYRNSDLHKRKENNAKRENKCDYLSVVINIHISYAIDDDFFRLYAQRKIQ
jgi:hypothetical protein